MCGICGIISLDGHSPVDPNVLKSMTTVLTHRGPDDEGFYLDGSVGLGFRRLSIIDIEGGHQPMHNENQAIAVVFNGEIYNFKELRLLLEKSGHRFRTKSDTEVIIHAYEQFAEECVNHFNGMFAFALWDKDRRRLLLARDRMGIKPLYYSLNDKYLVFSSEMKGILAHPSVNRSIDLVALNNYMSFEYVPTPRTIFQGVNKLPAGHTLIVRSGLARLHRYWNVELEQSECSSSLREADYVSRIMSTLRDVVAQEMVADVPVGVLLSGGIDSSAVALMAAQVSSSKIKTFSIAFEDSSFDEGPYARQVANYLGTDHHELVLDPNTVLKLIPSIAEFMDEPLGDSSLVPTYLVCRFARESVKVALGGDGGDELFGGYPTLQAHRLAGYYSRWIPSAFRRLFFPRLVAGLPVSFDDLSFDFRLRHFMAHVDEIPIVRHHLWLGSFTPDQKRQLLQPSAQPPDLDTYQAVFDHLRFCNAKSLFNQILYCDMKLYLEGDILVKVDRASMANSLEVRVPLLNHSLVTCLATVPHQLKLHTLTTKYILRRALEGHLPRSILERRKKGFNMPVAKWLLGPLGPLVKELLSERRLKLQGLFEPKYIKELVDEHTTRTKDNRKLLWTLLVFQLWYDRWLA
jgi:asparagine synthase (glutamine-hydrolysing)